MSPRDPGRRRHLSKDEHDLWSTVTRSIAPLRGMAVTEEQESVAAPVSAATKRHTKVDLAPPVQTAAPPPLTPLDRRMRSRVARGKQEIDARLDLHGLTQSEAHGALLHFLRKQSSRGARLVLVITGKGARPDDGGARGVLRRQVPHWLKLPEFRAFVIGFEVAHVAHGGAGALYVRVRRARGD